MPDMPRSTEQLPDKGSSSNDPVDGVTPKEAAEIMERSRRWSEDPRLNANAAAIGILDSASKKAAHGPNTEWMIIQHAKRHLEEERGEMVGRTSSSDTEKGPQR